MPLIAGSKEWAVKDMPDIRAIQLIAVAVSVLLTVAVVLQDHLPNNDGVLYLLIAEQIAAGGADSALRLFNWPFFSYLIAAFHAVSGLDVEVSAYAVNGLLQALLVYAFVGIVAEMGGRREVVLVAAFLLLSYPSLNELRSEIIRGFGYWAFVLLGLLFFLRSVFRADNRYTFAWIGAFAIATLFRFEGVVLLGLMPLALLLFPDAPRDRLVRRVLSIYVAYALGAVLLLAVMSMSGTDVMSLERWGKPVQMLSVFYAAITSELAHKAQILKDYYLIDYSEAYAWSIVWATILIVLITEVGSAVGLVYGLFAGYAMLACRGLMRPGAVRVVWFLVGVNALMLTAFVVSLGFLTKRYPVTLTLLILLLASFGALALYRRLDQAYTGTRRARLIRSAFAIVALSFFIDGVVSFSPGKPHVAEAAEWLAENAGPADRVLSLDPPLLYRAGQLDPMRYRELQALILRTGDEALRKRPSIVAALSSTDWQDFDFVVAVVKRNRSEQQREIEDLLARRPIKEFRNRKGDRALIYAVGTK